MFGTEEGKKMKNTLETYPSGIGNAGGRGALWVARFWAFRVCLRVACLGGGVGELSANRYKHPVSQHSIC